MANTQPDNKSTRKYINQYINKLTNTITTTLDQNVPTKTIKENQLGLYTLIRDMIKDKKFIRKKWQKNKDKTRYNQHNKEIKRLIKIENNNNWENKCNKY